MTNSVDDLYVQLRSLGMNIDFFKQNKPSREQLSELLTKATELTRRYGDATNYAVAR